MLVLGQKKIQRINDKCVARTGPITSTIFMIVYHYSVSMWWPNSGMGLFSQSPLLRCGLFFQSHPNIGYPWISSSYSTSVNLAAEIPDQYERDSKDHGLYFSKLHIWKPVSSLFQQGCPSRHDWFYQDDGLRMVQYLFYSSVHLLCARLPQIATNKLVYGPFYWLDQI